MDIGHKHTQFRPRGRSWRRGPGWGTERNGRWRSGDRKGQEQGRAEKYLVLLGRLDFKAIVVVSVVHCRRMAGRRDRRSGKSKIMKA